MYVQQVIRQLITSADTQCGRGMRAFACCTVLVVTKCDDMDTQSQPESHHGSVSYV